MQQVKYSRFIIVLIVTLFSGAQSVQADDPGITKVRLIQTSDSTYVFEADVPQILLSSISEPVFPERFRMTDLSFADESGWITIRVMYSSSGAPLLPSEEILLQWNRNGVDMTAQWLDGSTYKVLFNRSLGGIRIPVSELMVIKRSAWSVVKEGFQLGVSHVAFKGIHVLFIFLLLIMLRSWRSLRYLLWFSLGHYFSMILVELGIDGIDLLLSDLFILLACLLFSIHLIKRTSFNYLAILMLFLGLTHGMAYVTDVGSNNLTSLQQIQSLIAFNLATDLGHYLLALVGVLMIRWRGSNWTKKEWVPIASGALSICLILIVFAENVLPGKQRILNIQSARSAPLISLPKVNSGGRQVQRGSGLMTTPIVTYLSVEPYEVRQEILVQARSAFEIIDADQSLTAIPVEIQESIKSQLEDTVMANTSIRVNGQIIEPAETQAHFVTLNRGGVSSRLNPVVEEAEKAIIGLTLIYDIDSYPDSINMSWGLYPESSPIIEASTVDPHGALTTMISQINSQIMWRNKLARYQAAKIEIIEVERPPVPLISIILWFTVMVILVYVFLIKKASVSWNYILVVLVIAGIGFSLYPFLRTDSRLPFISEGTPGKERTSDIMQDLLRNVYIAFDRRGEEQVYDRLSLTVIGDQLTDIYLQNRQSMAMESRGGARAKVDEVNIKELYKVEREAGEGFVADVLWTVRGSVNHFGHTHYRQNQYRALVSFRDVDSAWKISDIETLDERRLY